MANNDIFIVDGIVDELVENSKSDYSRGEIFEKFVVSEILKSYDLTENELDSGIVDGKNDGGIDGFYIFVNGILVSNQAEKLPKTSIDLEVYIITSKHADTYSLAPLESIDSTISELFNLNLSESDLTSAYNEDILKKRALLSYCYRKLAARLEKFSINFVYASRGDVGKLADAHNISSKGEKILATCEQLFSNSSPSLTYWGATEIIKSYRKKRNGESIVKTQKIFQQADHFVMVVKLKDYYDFITDESKKLKRYFFDENVRDFLGENRTNLDIAHSLNEVEEIDFWLLNNGVTILVSSAVQTDGELLMESVQIVNGLQTSNCIYQYFSKGGEDTSNRSLLIKVIKSTESKVRNAIIQSTNNQSTIPLYSLHATDKIQKDIEDYMFQNGLYYERKNKYYQNLGYDKADIFDPLYLAYGYTALVLKLPHRAIKLKQKFMNKPSQYNKVFSEAEDIRIWPKVALVQRLVEPHIEKSKLDLGTNKINFMKTFRPLVCFILISKYYKSFSYKRQDLISLEITELSTELVEETVNDVVTFYKKLPPNQKEIKKMGNRNLVNSLLRHISNEYFLEGYETVAHRRDFIYDDYQIDDEFLRMVQSKLSVSLYEGIYQDIANELDCTPEKVIRAISVLQIDDDFLKLVQSKLRKPSYRGMHRDIAKELDCNAEKVSGAIRILRKKVLEEQSKASN